MAALRLLFLYRCLSGFFLLSCFSTRGLIYATYFPSHTHTHTHIHIHTHTSSSPSLSKHDWQKNNINLKFLLCSPDEGAVCECGLWVCVLFILSYEGKNTILVLMSTCSSCFFQMRVQCVNVCVLVLLAVCSALICPDGGMCEDGDTCCQP